MVAPARGAAAAAVFSAPGCPPAWPKGRGGSPFATLFTLLKKPQSAPPERSL